MPRVSEARRNPRCGYIPNRPGISRHHSTRVVSPQQLSGISAAGTAEIAPPLTGRAQPYHSAELFARERAVRPNDELLDDGARGSALQRSFIDQDHDAEVPGPA